MSFINHAWNAQPAHFEKTPKGVEKTPRVDFEKYIELYLQYEFCRIWYQHLSYLNVLAPSILLLLRCSHSWDVCSLLFTAMSTPSEPLILTPDEFAKLTARGVLKFHPPLQQDIKPQMTSMSRVVATPQPAPVINTNNDMDVSPVLFHYSVFHFHFCCWQSLAVFWCQLGPS